MSGFASSKTQVKGPFRLLVRNEALGSGHYMGSYATLEEAQAAAKREVKGTRTFYTAQPCGLVGDVKGTQERGES